MPEPSRTLVEATGGRVIVRGGGAAEFLQDLHARLALYAAHRTGDTPAAVHAEILKLLSDARAVDLDEALRRSETP